MYFIMCLLYIINILQKHFKCFIIKLFVMYFIMYVLYIINKLQYNHKYEIIKTILLQLLYIHKIIKSINTFFEIYQLV